MLAQLPKECQPDENKIGAEFENLDVTLEDTITSEFNDTLLLNSFLEFKFEIHLFSCQMMIYLNCDMFELAV